LEDWEIGRLGDCQNVVGLKIDDWQITGQGTAADGAMDDDLGRPWRGGSGLHLLLAKKRAKVAV
jgi:hypothetical protein